MPDRAEVLRIIDEAYARRARGDRAGVAELLAPEAAFRIAGDLESLRSFSAEDGARSAQTAVEALMDTFEFLEHERVEAVVEGNRAAILWRVKLRAEGKEPVWTELYDLWTLNDEGKVVFFLQFADTAMVARMMA